MAKAGQVLENPITGERLIFRKTSHESDGTDWEAETTFKPFTGKIPFKHFHPFLEERFEILQGEASYVVGKTEGQAKAGDVVVVPPATAHIHPWSVSNEELHMRQTLKLHQPDRKSLEKLEVFAETAFGLARDGKIRKDGTLHPLQLIVTLQALQPVGYMAGMPIMVQQVLFGVMAGIGRLLGYKARYPEYSGRLEV